MQFNLPYQKQKASDFILANQDKLICTIRKPERSRSAMQNRYYWFVLGLLEVDTGIYKNDWHDYFGEKFRRSTKDFNGEIMEFTRSSTALNTLDFEDYMTKIRTFASTELGIFIPLPNEMDYDYLKL
jgi:hypothetical protein